MKISAPSIMFLFVVCLLHGGCTTNSAPNEGLAVVTYEQFEAFVAHTGYITDAEQFGWSIVQQDVYNSTTIEGATWRKSDGVRPLASRKTGNAVSFNNALAYCEWAQQKLPSYKQYWELVAQDRRKVVANYNAPISEANNVNIVGNVWEIRTTEKDDTPRLAAGSLFYSSNTCHGTSRERELYVDKQAGNIHIGFAVVSSSLN